MTKKTNREQALEALDDLYDNQGYFHPVDGTNAKIAKFVEVWGMTIRAALIQEPVDLSVEWQEWCGVAWLCPVSWKLGWNACLDHLAQRYPDMFKGGV